MRKKIQDLLVQSFGTSYALGRVDVVWVQEEDERVDEGRDVVVRVSDAYVFIRFSFFIFRYVGFLLNLPIL